MSEIRSKEFTEPQPNQTVCSISLEVPGNWRLFFGIWPPLSGHAKLQPHKHTVNTDCALNIVSGALTGIVTLQFSPHLLLSWVTLGKPDESSNGLGWIRHHLRSKTTGNSQDNSSRSASHICCFSNLSYLWAIWSYWKYIGITKWGGELHSASVRRSVSSTIWEDTFANTTGNTWSSKTGTSHPRSWAFLSNPYDTDLENDKSNTRGLEFCHHLLLLDLELLLTLWNLARKIL